MKRHRSSRAKQRAMRRKYRRRRNARLRGPEPRPKYPTITHTDEESP